MLNVVPVILSGGAGTRLWPVSREAFPKPFMKLPDGQSLLGKTLKRAAALPGVTEVVTVTNREYFFHTRDEYSAAKKNLGFAYVLEPCGRNTAPAIAMAAFSLVETRGEDALMLVLPADHLIENQDAFSEAVLLAAEYAARGYLVTFGIPPTYPETGYGYIEIGDAFGERVGAVSRFVEKPSLEVAEEYLEKGNFLWNSGMFCFRAGSLLEAMREHAPQVYDASLACWEKTRTEDMPVTLDEASFSQIPDISIDYAVMEKAEKVAVVAGSFDWNDIGSWSAVSDLVPGDESGNRIVGAAVMVDSGNCYIQAESRLVAAVGVENLLVIDTPDALLVADKSRAQDVKRVVQHLKLAEHEAYRLHRTVHRPWGTYTVLEEGDRFKIKRIVVKAGAALSLQMHHHRSEHWVVVSGTAKIVNGDEERLVRTNESTFIPAGTPHRLVNPGVIDLVMIEVQSGEYLGEDDIVRFEDRYGRS